MEKNNLMLNITEIIKRIPHRYPFLMIDKVIELIDDQKIIGIKNVTANEPQFMGHFPNNPVMPGVLIIEAMAQLSAILILETIKSDLTNQICYLMSIENVKFRQIVTCGDSMIITSNIIKSRNPVWKFEATVCVNNKLVTEGSFTATMQDKNLK